MTKEELENLIKTKSLKTCRKCGFNLCVTEFYIKKSKNPDHWRFNSPCKSCSNIKRYAYMRKYNLKKAFDLSVDEYNSLLLKQNNECKICGIDQSLVSKKFAVDHCHSTGNVRGLLCTNCNLGLGNFKDSTKLLQKAINYLK